MGNFCFCFLSSSDHQTKKKTSFLSLLNYRRLKVKIKKNFGFVEEMFRIIIYYIFDKIYDDHRQQVNQ